MTKFAIIKGGRARIINLETGALIRTIGGKSALHAVSDHQFVVAVHEGGKAIAYRLRDGLQLRQLADKGVTNVDLKDGVAVISLDNGRWKTVSLRILGSAQQRIEALRSLVATPQLCP